MSKFQLICEEDQADSCPYCGARLSDWKSEFLEKFHYKICLCGCGKKISIKVDFLGSGHDSWNGVTDTVIESDERNEKNIEEKVNGK